MSNVDSNKKIADYQMGHDITIESMWLKYQNNSQGAWIIKPKAAVLLYKFLKDLKPKQILELGTGIGCATEVMAFACPDAHIYTVEHNQKCIDLAKKFIPEKFQERIFFKKTEPGISELIPAINPFVFWSGYKLFDWIEYDFIFVDGPGPFMAQIPTRKCHFKCDNCMELKKDNEIWEVLANQPNGDVLHMLPKMKPGTCVYLDGRREACNLYMRHLGHYLKLELRDEYRAIFIRNDTPLADDLSDFKNGDTIYDTYQKQGYFDEKIQEDEN